MAEGVTGIIIARGRAVESLRSMLAWSAVAHVALVTAVLAMPVSWSGESDNTERAVLTISLGGAPGPRSGGITPIAGRVVQAPLPEVAPARADRPPAQAEPEMGIPTQRRTRADVERTSESARGRTPTTGEEPQVGPARTDTGARGQGFGLSTGGGGGTDAYLDVGDFCCPDYLEQMVQLIQRNWDSRQGILGVTLMMFTIQRDGLIRGVQVEEPSGFVALDLAAQRALLLTTRLPALPTEFPNLDLTVHIRFEFQR
jgi:TonB family protein